MLNTFYGVWNKESGHLDTSQTLRGAKLFASKNVSRREGKYTRKLAKKLNGKWETL